ncbi:MAG: DUF2846 domain-containing protein [Magnetococcales bacterium]|nr:DUF2846 domain-containing protein [Magnetococcales bacterium]
MKIIIEIVALASLLILTGCAYVPMASLEQDSQAKAFMPATDKASLYIYRKTRLTASYSPLLVYINDKLIGKLKHNSYLHVSIAHGRYNISSKLLSGENYTLHVTAEPNKNYFISAEDRSEEIAINLMVLLEGVDEATGRAAVMESAMAVTSISDGYLTPMVLGNAVDQSSASAMQSVQKNRALTLQSVQKNIELTFSDGSKYFGDTKNGIMHGKGELTFPGGRYVGDFVDGKFHGQGTRIDYQSHSYTGSFANGLYHGEGILTYNIGYTYKGGFANGTFHGDGIVSGPNMETRETSAENGKLESKINWGNMFGIFLGAAAQGIAQSQTNQRTYIQQPVIIQAPPAPPAPARALQCSAPNVFRETTCR